MKLGRKKPQDASPQQEPQKEPQDEKPISRTRGLQVAKYEVSDDKVKFYVAKGFGKKKWVLVREIPVHEIEHVESDRNQLGLTVHGAAEWFYLKDEADTFTALAEQLNMQVPEQTPQQQETPQPELEIQPSQPQEEESQEIPQPKEKTAQPQLQIETPIPQPIQENQPPQQEPLPQPEPQPIQKEPQKPEETKPQGKLRSIKIGKYEVLEGKIRLSAAKGFFRKKWVVIREIPMQEVEKIDGEANRLTLTWKGNTEMFQLNGKSGSFKTLIDQVNNMLDEQRKAQEIQKAEVNEKNALRRIELLAVINRSVDIVDLTFNLLIDLQDKRINWQQVEAYVNGFGEKLNFIGQTLPPMIMDYTKIASAAKTQTPREAANEAFNLLKTTYEYFGGMKPEEDFKDNPPNFETAKMLISAYYLLNDLLLARFVGDKDNRREIGELEAALQRLAAANFKVDFEALKGSFSVEGEKQAVIEDSRALFKEQLKQL